MADLRIVDAPEIPTEDITGEEKLPTGGSGNYSISLDSLADYTKTKKDLVDNITVDNKVNGVRQELDAHIEDLLNPHQVTKDQIGLGNVDNTADADKPVSNSTQAAIISAVAPKADKTYIDTQLTLKANKADVYTKSETYTKQESSDLVNNSISTALIPINTSLDLAKRGVVNRYDSSLTYNSGERVVLANGDIVKSTIDGNANDPNSDMTGWGKGTRASEVEDASGNSQQEINDVITEKFKDLSDTTIHMQRYHLLIADGYWDEAIKQGVRDAVQSTFGGIFKLKFPAGVIKVRESSIFTLGLVTGTKRGLVIEGEGKQSTIFYMITRRADNSGNDPKWFYDNGQSNPKFDYVQTMNCSFTSDNKLYGHGFKVWSAGTEKAFLYNNCAFGNSANVAANLDTVDGGLGEGFYFWGTGNADQTDWVACNITTDDDLITLDNNQSVGFNFFGGTCSVYGDVIKVTGDGGGDVNWHGTTMHMLQKADETDMKYMVNVDADLSFGNDRFNFNSIRMELRGNYKGLVNAPRQTGTLNVNFDGAGLVSVGVTSNVTGLIIGASKKVTFNNTNIPERYYYELTSSSISLNNGGILGFESCCLGVGGSADVPLYKRILGVGNGCAYADDCYYNGSGLAYTFKIADFYLGGNANPRMPSRKLKAVNLKRSATAFPNAAGASGELSTEFPVGSFIKSITVIKPAVAGSSASYQLHVGNSDKSKTYGSSEELPFSSEHRVVVDVNLLATNETDAIVRVWATGLATNNVSGGVALVEYY